jgi:hypothetical protein
MESVMDAEYYCDECGDLRDVPGICAECARFEMIELVEHEAA